MSSSFATETQIAVMQGEESQETAEVEPNPVDPCKYRATNIRQLEQVITISKSMESKALLSGKVEVTRVMLPVGGRGGSGGFMAYM
jgi:hypothetical protein